MIDDYGNNVQYVKIPVPELVVLNEDGSHTIFLKENILCKCVEIWYNTEKSSCSEVLYLQAWLHLHSIPVSVRLPKKQ